ncbi:PREDICTED: uncharacterized protein LOC104719842 [Camelina sativa]|uniref:Uncharacterized protein LOC104719842 n=1 Tax=Camelina sativa TaxID=90675 RepID=A0ABM1QIB0_CAMSA|nr:PREDICTED: uncharacterized protein LOC104719842 [Camelina sativa]
MTLVQLFLLSMGSSCPRPPGLALRMSLLSPLDPPDPPDPPDDKFVSPRSLPFYGSRLSSEFDGECISLLPLPPVAPLKVFIHFSGPLVWGWLLFSVDESVFFSTSPPAFLQQCVSFSLLKVG